MFNVVSILIGLATLALGLIAFTPFLGGLNWIAIPVGIVGIAVGTLSRRRGGRNLNLMLVMIFAIRLWLGAGIF